ncbi:MAG: autoinducer binding domain-containing protein [Ramlibacter sp.]|nr:autoinducer binding domain-containing protein [Ramlibacter sp.]
MARPPRSAPADRAAADTVQVRHCVVDGKRISLSVRGNDKRGFRLERRCRSPGEPVSIQHLDLRDSGQVAEFIEHDPYADELGIEYRCVLGALGNRDAGANVPRPEFAFECENEGELAALMRSVCEACGATHCFYHWFVVDEQEEAEFESHHLLVGGPPAWAQRYVHQHRYLNDPAVAHAREDSQPLRGSALVSLAPEHWLNQDGRSHGLCSNVFLPAHRRDNSAFGLLHVSAPLAAPQGEEALWAHRRLLRGLADELLEWRVMRLRQELARELSLTYPEVLALRLVASGGSARHVAEELNLGEREIYQLFIAINRKMNSKHIKSSANKAKQYGLLAEAVLSN